MGKNIILSIAAGQEFSRKGENLVRRRLKYLNYGLLGLSSLIDQYSEYNVRMFQADDRTIEELILEIESTGISISCDCKCILLSIPSFHSISWCVKFCEYIKQNYDTTIIVGGRWVVDNHAEWVKRKLKHIDIISEGFGERFMSECFRFSDSEEAFDGKSHCFTNVNYRVLHNYLDYNPNLEISRGCGSGCAFCADSKNPRLRNKPVNIIMDELDRLDSIFEEYTPYYTAPHFVFNKRWVDEYCNESAKRSKIRQWRCTTRVESVPLDRLCDLRSAGMKVIDIGLESASITQLRRMQKSNKPELYLEKAEALIEACAQNDIWIKLNIMLYAGETLDTISETMNWLKKHKNQIKDVSAGSLVYYYNMTNLQELIDLGASIPSGQDLEENGFMNLNMSSEIDVAKAQELCCEIPRIVANQRDFYDIKKFSYYPQSYDYSAFMQDVRKCNLKDLPFRVEK